MYEELNLDLQAFAKRVYDSILYQSTFYNFLNPNYIGTRPEVQKYVDHYTDEMTATLLLPAGVTSLASINYRDEDEILEKYVDENHSVDEVYVDKILPDKMKYNLEYLKTFSIVGDIILCVKTVI